MPRNEKVIEWKQVWFSVRSGFWLRQKPILEGIDFHIGQGEAVGLVGPNGAGKTTTIKLGAGLLRPDRGQVLLQGLPAASVASRARLGLLTENQYIYGHLKLREWLEMLAALSRVGRGDRKKRVAGALERFELEGKAEQIMRTLSKGQIQRAGLAQAFLQAVDLLLLDEPMSGLDPRWRRRVQDLLLGFKQQGGTILFSSHILSDVERISDRVVLLDGGAIHWQGRLDALPRKLVGYEIVCRPQGPRGWQALLRHATREERSDGFIAVTVNDAEKEEMIRLAADAEMVLDAVRPIRQEIQEALFGFAEVKTEGRHGA